LFSFVTNQLHAEFKTLIGNSLTQGQTLLFISLFLFIALNNRLGLFPYIFTATSHLSLTLRLAFPL
jgi:F-type H+-transporting ATPase subunit a